MKKLLLYLLSGSVFSGVASAHTETMPILHNMLHSTSPSVSHYWQSLGFYGILSYILAVSILLYGIYYVFQKPIIWQKKKPQ